jgi:hypothetical protein
MNENHHPRRMTRKLVSPHRAKVWCLSTSAVLLLVGVFVRLGTAAAQQQPPPASDLVPPLTTPIPGSPTPDLAKEKAEEPPTPAEQTIDEAKSKITKLKSCAAELVLRVEMLNQQPLTIKGRYRMAPQSRVYFLLTLSGLPDTTGTTLQVCDGDMLWDVQAILESRAYHKFSIKPVMLRLNSPEIDPKMREQFKDGMGFAGPESLLSGLRRLFRFDQEKQEGKLGDKPVWILRGTWKSRQGMLGPDQRPVALSGLLPPYIPSDAVLYLGKDDGWPYKLVLRGRELSSVIDTRKIGPDGRRIGSLSSRESVAPTNITLEYTEVKLNPELATAEFAFEPPPDASVEDGTEMIVKQLDQMIAVQAERKKVEASKNEGPVLEQPLEIAPPPGTPSAAQPSKP